MKITIPCVSLLKSNPFDSKLLIIQDMISSLKFDQSDVIVSTHDLRKKVDRPNLVFNIPKEILVNFQRIPLGCSYMLLPKNLSKEVSHAIGCGYNCETLDYKLNGQKRGKEPYSFLQLTLSGRGHLTFNKKNFDLNPGDLMMVTIPSNHVYCLPPSSNHWSFVFLSIYGDEAVSIFKQIIQTNGGPVLKIPPDSEMYFFLSEICSRSYKNRIKNHYDLVAIYYQAISILVKILNKKEEVDYLPPSIIEARNYCLENFKENISNAEIAKHVNLSTSYFSNVFQKLLGISPRTYLEELRLNHAAKLLSDSSLSIKRVSQESGFRDPNYFTKVFKKKYGITPRHFFKKKSHVL